MSQSLSKLLVHLVFSTKNRECCLNDAIRSELHAYAGAIVANMDGTLLRACLKSLSFVAAEVRRRRVRTHFALQIRLLTSAATVFKQALIRSAKISVNKRSKIPIACFG